MKITSIVVANGVECELHQEFILSYPDLNHLEQALASFSRKYPATLFAFDVVEKDDHRNFTYRRYYAANGKSEVVDARFQPCSLKPVVMMPRDVTFSFPHGTVLVNVMVPEDALRNEVEYAALKQILAWNDVVKERIDGLEPWQ